MSTTTHHFRSKDYADGFVAGIEHPYYALYSVKSPGSYPCPYEPGAFDVRLEDDDTGDFDIHGDLGYGLDQDVAAKRTAYLAADPAGAPEVIARHEPELEAAARRAYLPGEDGPWPEFLAEWIAHPG
jgi:hypothetical protein